MLLLTDTGLCRKESSVPIDCIRVGGTIAEAPGQVTWRSVIICNGVRFLISFVVEEMGAMVRVQLNQMIVVIVCAAIVGAVSSYVVPIAFSLLAKDGSVGLLACLVLLVGCATPAFAVGCMTVMMIKTGA